ncbi:hypothetical protein [Actinoplanes sp. NPDC051851]|uniref:hypothetical protein n=1 Tax=Actinoplanes sp. NPDC051851 TaxID=3154753 RepID=UPI003445ED49
MTVAVLIGLTTWALWPEPPRQREYLDATACLLTDEKGIAAEPATSVWATMQELSAVSLVRVQYLPVNGPQTAGNAVTYATSLAIGRCGAIVATGEPQAAAVGQIAATYPAIRFITVGAGTTADNVEVVTETTGEALRGTLKNHLDTLADAAT